ncbi:integrator complex subunit 12-like [Ptychodera flava]|uniref:integrator complex subunit 12-like n=1 Tax=Ptychodera flava TaxID=63121 RepID=UPI00396A82FA
MATFELDPLFLKALTLLHSKSKDATEQLRQMADDAIATSQDKSEKSASEPRTVETKSQTPSSRPVVPSKKESTHGKSTELKKEAEKRSAEKLKPDPTDVPKEAKKQKLDETVSKPKLTESLFLRDDTGDEDSNDKTEDSTTDADDFAMEMGLACVLCRQLDVAPGNQLVECQECHNLYHQKCHKPPASDADVNDPRVVWYCGRCSRNMKKMASKQKTKSSGTKELTKKTEERRKVETVMPFKRTETSIATSKTSSSGASLPSSHQPLVGLASLAANLSGKSSSSKMSSSSSLANKPLSSSSLKSSTTVSSSKSSMAPSSKSGSTLPPVVPAKPLLAPSTSKPAMPQLPKPSAVARPAVSGATSTANAMKRLQMMKKKAAKR